MSENSTQNAESAFSSEEAVLQEGLRELSATQGSSERINMEVIRQISAGNDLETWTLQLRRRLAWMAVPFVVGGAIMGLVLQCIVPASRYVGKIDYSEQLPLAASSLLPAHYARISSKVPPTLDDRAIARYRLHWNTEKGSLKRDGFTPLPASKPNGGMK